ncbi:MAG: hypothetical protein JNL13_07540 [Chitinophagaceae bacterium]|nr:hypothetical protein [Chitinophagaceae bacterium]
MKRFFPALCAATTMLCSCDANFTTSVSETKAVDTAMHSMPTISGKHCYVFAGAKDTIRMTVTVNDKQASGSLSYKLSEKDRNEGRFEGTMSGDTLFADYHFQSEGVQSVREVAFILSDSKAVEAYGALVVTNEGTRFSDRRALSADHSFTLSKENCTEE